MARLKFISPMLREELELNSARAFPGQKLRRKKTHFFPVMAIRVNKYHAAKKITLSLSLSLPPSIISELRWNNNNNKRNYLTYFKVCVSH